MEHLTHTAFWVCAMHEFVGGVVEYFESPSFCTTKLRPGQTQADVQTFFQDLAITAITGYRLPELMSDWTHLLLTDAEAAAFAASAFGHAGGGGSHHGSNRQAVALHSDLMEGLARVSDDIQARNFGGGRPRPFAGMDPREFECSVSI